MLLNRSKQHLVKMLDKIELDDIKPSSRKYPFINFQIGREIGNDVLTVDGLTASHEGETLFKDMRFSMNKEDKIVLLGSPMAKTALLDILMEEADLCTFKWGVTTSQSYFENDHDKYFEGSEKTLVEWLRQYSPDDETESFLRGFLGRMLFSGEEVKKSLLFFLGRKVRCMLSKMMLATANVILLDEPTNHLDLESIQALNEGLIRFKGAMIFTSHDHQFIQTIANRVIEIREDGSILDKQLTYDEFLEWKDSQGLS